MLQFIINRFLYGLLVIWGVITVVFMLFHALPGDPVDLMSGQHADLETRELIRHELGLDKPLIVQYGRYLSDLSIISIEENTEKAAKKYHYFKVIGGENYCLVFKPPYLRKSFQTNKRVDDILLESLPGTFWLSLAAILIASILGVFLGVVAALNYGQKIDHFIISGSVVFISMPSFVLAILMAMIFGYYLSDITHLSMTGSLWVNDPIYGRQLHLENIILPAITLATRPLAIIVQLTRSSMLDVMSQDYVRTAKAKGAGFVRVVTVHTLRNALNPVITAVSGWLATMLAGAFFIEYIFKWKGLGFKTIQAVEYLDLPVVMGSTIFIAFGFVVVNIFVDILYAVLDPKIRLT
ncbi:MULTISPECIES: ABC transporter permease [Flammeovirga]|uniref:ABC transporter permease n=1 Tax=Flammeovirga agarivorans TaxID=2726742 RepID=A0A7X8SHA7_9BACT|nr:MULTISPECIES: ABC transporter permease [Flammeovirga]NLR90179.1 ABC transporter permease [Flammeovirga agarivorans]